MAGKQPEDLGPASSRSASVDASEDLEEAPTFQEHSELLPSAPESSAPGTDLEPPEASDDSQPSDAPLPDRYTVKESGEGDLLRCLEAPNIVVKIERGFSVNGAAARKYPSGSIFLDGAAQESPFLDTERHVYNLDHHEGCVRSFTLSTCEQAYILIRKGLHLREREWTIYANEPDLDTVLAIWVLLNYRHVNGDDPEIRDRILPLLRLEGLIDVHGLEMQDLACFSEDLQRETNAKISELLELEMTLKREGRWSEISLADYTAGILRRIDGMVYSPWHFDGFHVIDELSRVEITDKQIAVICRSDAGIYEVEQQLIAIHENRLGMIVLQKDPSNYTLRQVNLFLPINLRRVYAQLNLIDPAVRRGGPSNKWGGSAEIGGSPRATGTDLSPSEIADALLRCFHKPTLLQIVSTAAVTVITSLIALLAGWAAAEFADRSPAVFTEVFCASSLVLLFLFARHYPRVYGLRLPVGRDWLLLLPAAVLGAAMGGIWAPRVLADDSAAAIHPMTLTLLALGLPLACELLFRGLAHGLWAEELRAQRSGGRWFVSWPAIGSSILFAFASLVPLIPRADPVSLVWPMALAPAGLALLAVQFLGALFFGLACCMARERSESLLAPILFHWLCLGLFLLSRVLV